MNKIGKPEIVFVLTNILGGVASLNKNIINNSSLREKAYIKLILLTETDANHSPITDTFLADEIVDFRFANYENQYSVLKRLAECIGAGPGAVFCNDAREMEAISLYGTGKTVFQFIHDFYNIRLAVRYGAVTDVYLTHTAMFRDVLQSADPVNIKALHLRHGVSIPQNIAVQATEGDLKIVFTGRLIEAKGVQDLFQVDQLLNEMNVRVRWTIIGRGVLRDQLSEQWSGKDNVVFASPDRNEDVMTLMAEHDMFILPTRFEGSPVTILEALAVGLVPLVSDLPGGIREVVNEDVGVRIPLGDNQKFAEAIAGLHRDRAKLLQMRKNSRKTAEENYNISITSDNYFRTLLQFADYKVQRPPLPLKLGYGLDKTWLPNEFVSFARKNVIPKVKALLRPGRK